MAFVTKVKDPEDKLDYRIDWAAAPGPDKPPGLAVGETITTSTWTVYDASWVPTDDLTIHDELNANDDTTATGWVSGGSSGNTVYFTNHIATNQGRELSYSIKIKIKEQ